MAMRHSGRSKYSRSRKTDATPSSTTSAYMRASWEYSTSAGDSATSVEASALQARSFGRKRPSSAQSSGTVNTPANAGRKRSAKALWPASFDHAWASMIHRGRCSNAASQWNQTISPIDALAISAVAASSYASPIVFNDQVRTANVTNTTRIAMVVESDWIGRGRGIKSPMGARARSGEPTNRVVARNPVSCPFSHQPAAQHLPGKSRVGAACRLALPGSEFSGPAPFLPSAWRTVCRASRLRSRMRPALSAR